MMPPRLPIIVLSSLLHILSIDGRPIIICDDGRQAHQLYSRETFPANKRYQFLVFHPPLEEFKWSNDKGRNESLEKLMDNLAFINEAEQELSYQCRLLAVLRNVVRSTKQWACQNYATELQHWAKEDWLSQPLCELLRRQYHDGLLQVWFEYWRRLEMLGIAARHEDLLYQATVFEMMSLDLRKVASFRRKLRIGGYDSYGWAMKKEEDSVELEVVAAYNRRGSDMGWVDVKLLAFKDLLDTLLRGAVHALPQYSLNVQMTKENDSTYVIHGAMFEALFISIMNIVETINNDRLLDKHNKQLEELLKKARVADAPSEEWGLQVLGFISKGVPKLSVAGGKPITHEDCMDALKADSGPLQIHKLGKTLHLEICSKMFPRHMRATHRRRRRRRMKPRSAA